MPRESLQNYQSPACAQRTLFDYLDDNFPDGDEIALADEDENPPLEQRRTLAWRKVHPDGRGKHDRTYRKLRKERIEAFAIAKFPTITTDCCGFVGQRDDVFTDTGICMVCGCVSDDISDRIEKKQVIDRGSSMGKLVSYDPRFYVKERLGNWKCDCPAIPNEHFKKIITEIVFEIGRTSGFSARDISRTLIYNVVNRLFGNSPWRARGVAAQNRRYLVYRERWLSIKRWMCEQAIFSIPDAREWLDRYYRYEPNKALIDMLERMMRILESSFKRLLYSEKKDGLMRHNRPRRDVAILFLLYGLHPALSVIYGTDYWKPPVTKKSKEENTQRFKILLANARQHERMLHWPSDDVTLDMIEATTSVTIHNVDMMDVEIDQLFNMELYNGIRFDREECMLF